MLYGIQSERQQPVENRNRRLNRKKAMLTSSDIRLEMLREIVDKEKTCNLYGRRILRTEQKQIVEMEYDDEYQD